jgi:2-amino-4-hydroxy-6-hydroxymethyldihydropteridine diphosphokinase
MPTGNPSVKVVIMLGSNDGARMDFISRARELIKTRAGKISRVSSVYETAPWGNENQPDFLNQAVVIETMLPPHHLLDLLLKIEKDLGRIRGKKWAIRTIDIDILFYGDEIINDNDLVIPHPRMNERKFTLLPLNEIMPSFIHPVTRVTIKELTAKCSDAKPVHKIPGSAAPVIRHEK